MGRTSGLVATVTMAAAVWGVVLLGAALAQGPSGVRTALHNAVAEADIEQVRRLLDQGANINARDMWGDTPLHLAARGHEGIVRLLLERGADVNNVDGERHRTALHAAVGDTYMNTDVCVSIVRLLLHGGADAKAKDDDGITPLFLAVNNRQAGAAHLLIAKGADVNARRQTDRTLLHDAAARGHLDVAEVLLAHGARVNAVTTLGTTPLHLAAQEGYVNAAEVLVAHGADVNARSLSGGTPLHEAARRGHHDVAAFLLDKGADASIKTTTGKTALDFAQGAGRDDLVQLLTHQRLLPTDAAGPESEEASATPPRTDLEALVRGNAAFAMDLYAQLRASPGNLFLSPYSVSMSLAMARAGAAGTTEKEMAAVLHLDKVKADSAFAELLARLNEIKTAGHVQLYAANSLWPQQGYALQREYKALLRTNYGVSVTLVDYVGAPEAACWTINAKVAQMTGGKIRNLIGRASVNDLTRLVLVNAIYFKGTWLRPFDPQDTSRAPFYVSPTKSVQVDMMTQSQEVRYADLSTHAILELPYRGEDLSMFVLLPKRIDGVAQLEQDLSVSRLEQWRARLKYQEVHIILPKYKMATAFELTGTLRAMGMMDAFNNPQSQPKTGSKADFSRMDGGDSLYISAVAHKAFIEVNEEGTEAAAATGMVAGGAGLSPVPTFRADHPFLFLIQENRTGSILFLGRLADPSDASGD